MKTAVNQLHEKVAAWTTEIANILALAQKLNLPPPDLQSYHHKIAKLYSEELDLCYLLDKSDIIFHANGTAITDHSFGLSAVNSLFKNIDQQIKRHALSVLQLSLADTKKALQMLDIRLTGIAAGSLYAGFLIQPPKPSELLGTDEQNLIMQDIKSATLSIAQVPQFVNQQGKISEGLSEQVQNPAIRDSAIVAAFHLSPTGKNGITSIDIITPSQMALNARLDVTHRHSLKEAVNKNPIIESKAKNGTFTGQLSRIDLNKNRFDLREVNAQGVKSLRCILPTLTPEKGREILGKQVIVTGRYEQNHNGKPSLMMVYDIKVLEQKLIATPL